MSKKEKDAILLEEAKKELAKHDRHFGVLLEDIDDKWGRISEGLEVLDKKIDRHYAEFRDFRAEANEKFDMLFDGQKDSEKCQKQLLGDNQEFFSELRTVKVDVTNLDRRVTILEK
jgi:hypothetical protein